MAKKGKKKADRKDFDGYFPDERLIYKFHDGAKWVAADPIVLWQRLTEVGPTLAIDVKVALSPRKTAKQSEQNAIDKIRGIFNLKPLVDGLDATGTLSNEQTAELLDHYLKYIYELKKNSIRWPTSSVGPTEPLSEDTSPAESTTEPIADSGSAASANGTGPSAPSPTELQPDLETANRMRDTLEQSLTAKDKRTS